MNKLNNLCIATYVYFRVYVEDPLLDLLDRRII